MAVDEWDTWEQLPEVMHGYRFDTIRPDGRIGFFGQPEEPGPRMGERPNEEQERWTPAAFCLKTAHAAPHCGCRCGWYAAASLPELCQFQSYAQGVNAMRYSTGNVARYRQHTRAIPGDRIEARPIVVEVTAFGPNYPGTDRDDTDTTVRSAWLFLEDRIWIRDDVPRPVVRAARRRYPHAEVERFHSAAQLAASL